MRGHVIRWALVVVFAGAVRSSRAQSASLLQAVHTRRPNAAALAARALDACRASKSCADEGRLALLAGYLALAGGDAETARVDLESADPGTPLAPFTAYYSGEACFYSGRFMEAATAFAKAATGPDWLASRAKAREGEALLEAGHPKKAEPLLDSVVDDDSGPALLWAAAQARAATGDAAGARAALMRLAVRFPAEPKGQAAFQSLSPSALDLESRLERAQRLFAAGDSTRALTALKRLLRSGQVHLPADRARIALLEARIDYAENRRAAADRAVRRAQRGPKAFAAQALLLEAKDLLDQSHHARARALFARIARRYPKTDAASAAGFYAGWIDLQDGKLSRAARRLRRFVKAHPRSSWADDAAWYLALSRIEQHRYGAARKILSKFVSRRPTSSLIPQARYWAVRTLQLAHGPAADVEDGYRKVIRLSPGSFYAVLASARLRELGISPPDPFPTPPPLKAGTLPHALVLAEALSKTGLFADAAREVAARVDQAGTPDAALSLGQALERLHLYGWAYQLAIRRLWSKGYGDLSGPALALLYPEAFAPDVRAQARAQGIDPFSIWAVMRRESAFFPDQLSGANARGLLQLLPRTADRIAQRLKLDPPDPDALFGPALNVRLGSWYLAKLIHRFGHPVLWAAAYNAGPKAVSQWLERSGKLPLDLFVEEIPYRETRRYAKRVVADLYTYHALYGGKSAPKLSLELPHPSDGISF